MSRKAQPQAPSQYGEGGEINVKLSLLLGLLVANSVFHSMPSPVYAQLGVPREELSTTLGMAIGVLILLIGVRLVMWELTGSDATRCGTGTHQAEPAPESVAAVRQEPEEVAQDFTDEWTLDSFQFEELLTATFRCMVGIQPEPAPENVAAVRQEPEEVTPDFTGEWTLVDSFQFEEFLTATGVGFMQRQVAARLTPVQVWERREGGTWQFSVQNPLGGTKVEAFPIGQPIEEEVFDSVWKKTSSWVWDETSTWQGFVLETTAVETTGDGRRLVFRRYEREGQLFLEMSLKTLWGWGSDVTCTRVFSRRAERA